uniref:Uncharacterized protein n=1 Tax=Lactuca sativa TaxID=4236 RepID=A0A9R1XNX9_LACSA|nr:hypothetical protein LSAT_V11C200059770 [Lactuca sativa]
MFMMTFEGVMERQRHNQIVNNFNTTTTFPKLITHSMNEPLASKVYTHNFFFYEVQKEISRSEDTCFQKAVTSSNGVDIVIVLEKQKNICTKQPKNDGDTQQNTGPSNVFVCSLNMLASYGNTYSIVTPCFE